MEKRGEKCKMKREKRRELADYMHCIPAPYA
jgi:hypothetical protein